LTRLRQSRNTVPSGALYCAALSGVEMSGVEVSGVEVSEAKMPRGDAPSGAEGECIMRKILCEIDLEIAQGYPGRYFEYFFYNESRAGSRSRQAGS